MAAERMIRGAILSSEKINKLSTGAEVFFRRLMSIADDFGRYDGRPQILRAQLYALRLDKVSDKDVSTWLEETINSENIRYYYYQGKPYLEIVDFGQRLRAQRSRWPAPDEGEQQKPAAVSGKKEQAAATQKDPLLQEYELLIKDIASIRDFITARNPTDITPYIDYWNLFAAKYKFPKVKDITEGRKKKFAARIREYNFKLTKILYRVSSKGDDFIMQSKWFSFDWIIENSSNYLKVLEGNYDKKDQAAGNTTETGETAQQLKEAAFKKQEEETNGSN